MELTTYKVTFLETKDEWLFQYDKEGIIYSFTNMKGKRILNLLDKNQFPGVKTTIEEWIKFKKFIQIELVLEDYSFEAFWIKYNLKQKKELAEKAYNKLSLVNKILCWKKYPAYEAYITSKGITKALMVTWINQKRYLDEY